MHTHRNAAIFELVMKIEESEDRDLSQARSKPDLVDQPIRIARTIAVTNILAGLRGLYPQTQNRSWSGLGVQAPEACQNVGYSQFLRLT